MSLYYVMFNSSNLLTRQYHGFVESESAKPGLKRPCERFAGRTWRMLSTCGYSNRRGWMAASFPACVA